jgi:hypothetical protein
MTNPTMERLLLNTPAVDAEAQVRVEVLKAWLLLQVHVESLTLCWAFQMLAQST